MSIENLHAHVDTASVDCDGPMYREYVVTPNDAEIAEHEEAQGINDFSDIHFMNRVFTSECSPYAVAYGMTVKVDEHGFTWNEATDEGHRSGEVRWCRDEDCDPRAQSQRDVYAEMMGY